MVFQYEAVRQNKRVCAAHDFDRKSTYSGNDIEEVKQVFAQFL